MNPLLEPNAPILPTESKTYEVNVSFDASGPAETIVVNFRPDLLFRPKRIIPRDASFWYDFTIKRVQIGVTYQGPKGWDWNRNDPHAVSQAELDAYVFDTMLPNMELRLDTVSLHKAHCSGFTIEGVVIAQEPRFGFSRSL